MWIIENLQLIKNMRTITIATAGWNESATIIPLIRYYLDICKFNKFIYFDNYSDDNTIEKINQHFPNDNRITILNTPYVGHLPSDEVHLMNNTMLLDTSDVFIWIDSDEILYCKDWQNHLDTLVGNNKYYSATLMSNVYNSIDCFDETKVNIIDNFEQVYTDSVFKIPIIIKSDKHVIHFCGGHHSIRIDGVNVGDNHPDSSFADPGLHLFHFTYLNTEIYHQRKTLGRARNLQLGVDNSWFHNYWNLDKSTIQDMIDKQKAQSVSITKFL